MAIFYIFTIGLATIFSQLAENYLTHNHNPSLPYNEQILVKGGSDPGQKKL